MNGGYSKNLKEDYASAIEEFIRYEISDILDSLSFYDGSKWFDLDEYIKIFKSLELIYKDIDKWDGYFTFTEDADVNENQYILLVNKIEKNMLHS